MDEEKISHSGHIQLNLISLFKPGVLFMGHANSISTLQYAASHVGLYCLLTGV